MACIIYDKEGKAYRVKAQFVDDMLKRGYTGAPVKKSRAVKQEKPKAEAE